MGFLIDANLPYRFSLWKQAGFTHVYEIDPALSDRAIWAYAKERDMVIVTKDADFSDRMMVEGPPPRVVHLRVGNLKIGELRRFLEERWPQIEMLCQTHKLLNVYQDKIIAIGQEEI